MGYFERINSSQSPLQLWQIDSLFAAPHQLNLILIGAGFEHQCFRKVLDTLRE